MKDRVTGSYILTSKAQHSLELGLFLQTQLTSSLVAALPIGQTYRARKTTHTTTTTGFAYADSSGHMQNSELLTDQG